MTVFSVKHSPLLRQPEHFISRDDLKALICRITDNLVNIKDETGEFLLRLDDGRVIDTKGWAGWEWTHGIGLYGIYQYYQQTGDDQMRAIIDDWFEARLAEGTPTKNVNTVCPFLTLAYRYEETRDARWVPYLERWAEWVMYDMPRTQKNGLQHIVYNSENTDQLWDDTLMMSVLPLAKIGKLLNRPEFIELLELPEGNATRRFLLQVLESQIEALAQYQDDSGLWHTLLDDANSYVESSATAGFAYGILKAVRKRYVDKRYAEMAEKAIRGVIANINPQGELVNVSFGTAMGRDLDYYRQIPLNSMPYGQAMAILCLSEYLRIYL